MCVFFVSVYSITSRNNASISNFGGGFRCKKFKSKHFPTVFKKIEKNKKKKNDGKTGNFTQYQFSTKSIFLYGCNSKTYHCKYFKFSPNVYVSVIIYTHSYELKIVFSLLKHKPPFSLITGNWVYPRLTNHLRSESYNKYLSNQIEQNFFNPKNSFHSNYPMNFIVLNGFYNIGILNIWVALICNVEFISLYLPNP
ncbi:Uncharacterized protein FWK35_00012000 [Aphis craccivora]|uniref:Uncharacterized protein n=1 Tax=Aphis craccivora TaxID=307492 RepID=A0A6G0Z711_APHCR|nr:Uncharacterized protein FWK35_00012000 [Aphis craccivora]